MMKSETASISIKRIVLLSLIIIFLLGIGVLAANTNIRSVKIILSNNYEINVFTTKTKVSEILEENHIIILPEENVIPSLDSNITESGTITISKTLQDGVSAIKLSEESTDVTLEQLLGDYTPIVERIVTEQIEIPFETITKDIAEGAEDTTNKVITQGKVGIKEIVARVKYQNDIEIERTIISETIISEPVNKVVQVKKNVTNRSTVNTAPRTTGGTTASSVSLAKSVEGKTPVKKTFNTSAYCSCSRCCGKQTGITSSGKKASTWYTLAAGSAYPIGTIIYIPYFKDKPNGGWFVVQDRGGAIKNNKLDVYMGTHNQALQFGRRNLECYVYM